MRRFTGKAPQTLKYRAARPDRTERTKARKASAEPLRKQDDHDGQRLMNVAHPALQPSDVRGRIEQFFIHARPFGMRGEIEIAKTKIAKIFFRIFIHARGLLDHENRFFHIDEGAGKTGGKAVRQQAEGDGLGVAKEPDDAGPPRRYAFINAMKRDPATPARMDRSIRWNGNRLPDFPPDIFIAGQICSESELHSSIIAGFRIVWFFLIEAGFVFLYDRCMLSGGFPHFSLAGHGRFSAGLAGYGFFLFALRGLRVTLDSGGIILLAT